MLRNGDEHLKKNMGLLEPYSFEKTAEAIIQSCQSTEA